MTHATEATAAVRTPAKNSNYGRGIALMEARGCTAFACKHPQANCMGLASISFSWMLSSLRSACIMCFSPILC